MRPGRTCGREGTRRLNQRRRFHVQENGWTKRRRQRALLGRLSAEARKGVYARRTQEGTLHPGVVAHRLRCRRQLSAVSRQPSAVSRKQLDVIRQTSAASRHTLAARSQRVEQLTAL